MKLEKEIKFDAREGLRAEINLSSCGLHVVGNDEQEAHLKITMESITSLKEDEEISDYVEMNYDEESNRLSIEQKKRNLPPLLKNLHLELIIPQSSEISCRNTNGGIKAENIILDQDYELTNGGVKIIACRGRLEVRSINGGINVLDHQGDLELEQKNGGISVQDSRGKMNLINGNGGVKLNHCRGELKLDHTNGGIKSLNSGFTAAAIKTVNSNIYYEFEDEVDTGEFGFENQHGKIQLIIPQEIPYNIKARNRHGKVVIGLDKSYEQTGEGEKEFSLVNGAGTVNIVIENRHGSIYLLDELHQSEDWESKISRKVEVLLKDKIIPTLENLTAENAPKIQKQIRKAGEKLSKIEINIPNIENKVKKTLDQVSESITVNLDDNAEDIEKYKKVAIDKVNKAWENISDFVAHKKPAGVRPADEPSQATGKSKDKNKDVNERSRLKILELLEKGTITTEEAEKLLKALNGGE